MTDRFDYQRQADDDEQQQMLAPQVAQSARTAIDAPNIVQSPAELAPDPYWLSEMKRLKAYNEAWTNWANKEKPQWP